MIAKQHRTRNGIIVALCDDKILGKKFFEGDAVLDLSSDFYKGEKVSRERAAEICKRAYIINAVGEESVSLLVSQGFIEKNNIKKISRMPFAQCIVIENEI